MSNFKEMIQALHELRGSDGTLVMSSDAAQGLLDWIARIDEICARQSAIITSFQDLYATLGMKPKFREIEK